MKSKNISMESEKMSEKEVREHNEKTASWMVNLAAVNGKVVSHDEMRKKAQEFAEQAHKEGKI